MNALRRRGGANVQAVSAYASNGKAWVFAQNLAKDYRQRGWHSISDASISSVKPQSYTLSASSGAPRVVLLGCEDTSRAKLVDRNGNPAVKLPPNAPQLFRDTVEVVQLADERWVVDAFKTAVATSC